MARVENPKSPLVGKLKGVHLFHFDGAPCAQRVRFALREKGLRRGREIRFDDDSDAARIVLSNALYQRYRRPGECRLRGEGIN